MNRRTEIEEEHHRWKLDLTTDVDLDLPGYAGAKQLQAEVQGLGIKYLHLTRPEYVEAM